MDYLQLANSKNKNIRFVKSFEALNFMRKNLQQRGFSIEPRKAETKIF